jgi:hypothetical protein
VKLQPLFEDRPFPLQLIGAIVVPVIFGIVTGMALGWNGVVYWILIGPLAILGGLIAGTEHNGPGEGFIRGLLGGLVYGSFVLIGFEIVNTDAKAYLGDPQVGLVFVTTLVGGLLGALGGAYRGKLERDQGPPGARPPTASAAP